MSTKHEIENDEILRMSFIDRNLQWPFHFIVKKKHSGENELVIEDETFSTDLRLPMEWIESLVAAYKELK